MQQASAVRILTASASVWIGAVLFAAPTTKPTTVSTTNPTSQPSVERRFLTADEIQKIRCAELAVGDVARVQIPQDVRRAYAKKRGVSFSDFTARPAVEQALDILDNGDESMRSKIKVMSDPNAVVEYKKIQPMIITGCASMGCHGGHNAGDFHLFPNETEQATYTNFYILMKYAARMTAKGDGFFGGSSDQKLVERGSGEHSLLAQFGLPAGKSKLHHPAVQRFNGIFRDTDDPRYLRVIDWMNKSLKPIEQSYGIDYAVGGASSAATQPTTNPTTKPATKSRGKATRPATRPSTRPS